MVQGTFTTMVVAYKDRLKQAMTDAQVDETALAKQLGITKQAVMKVLAGRSNALSAENNSKAARYLNVGSDWLATGDGEKRAAWPFVRVTREQLLALDNEDRLIVEGALLMAIHNLAPHKKGELPPGVVLIPERRQSGARSVSASLKSLKNEHKPRRRAADKAVGR